MNRTTVAIRMALVVVALTTLGGCAAVRSIGSATDSGKSGIEVTDVWISLVGMPMATGAAQNGAPTPANAAAYMRIQNTSDTPDRLLRAESDVARALELHTTTTRDNVMEMRPVEAIDVPARGEVKLESGGYHLMLIGLSRPLEDGAKVEITLVFEKAGSVQVKAEVRQASMRSTR